MNLKSTITAMAVAAGIAANGQQLEHIPDSAFRARLMDEGLAAYFVGDSLDVSAPAVQAIDTLSFNGSSIGELTGIEHFGGLSQLLAANNDLTFIGQLPEGLQHLYVGNNEITSISDLPTGLTYLDIQGNSIGSIPDLPSGLQHLNVRSNDLSSLPSLPSSLLFLDCVDNMISELPTLPNGLFELNYGDSSLAIQPILPASIRVLTFSQTISGELPDLNNGLEILGTSGFMETLPELPESLLELYCNNNVVTHLPELPNNIHTIQCWNNELTGLPYLPDSLEVLVCHGNDIELLPPLPEGLWHLMASNNNLTCLPWLPSTLTFLNIEGNDVQCFPNQIGDLQTAPWVVTAEFWGLDYCTSNNPFGCTSASVITGRVAVDGDEDCTVGVSEIGLANRMVQSGSIYALTDSLGYYELYVDTGEHEVEFAQPLGFPVIPELWETDCPGIPYSVNVGEASDTVYDIDFPRQPLEDCHWLWVDVGSSNHRPCFDDNFINISYCNYGTAEAIGAYIDIEFPTEISPVSGTMGWTVQPNGDLRFDIGDLGVGECGSITVYTEVDCDLDLVGHTACYDASIYPISPCLTPGAGWDNSSLSVTGTCNGNDVEFVITNTGSGNMSTSSTYTIYENNSIHSAEVPFQLNAGDFTEITVPSNGSTYWISVEQILGHPGLDDPTAFVEACGPPPYTLGVTTGYSQNDIDHHSDVECVTFTVGYDPNDKQVIPAGYDSDHKVHYETIDLEYTIRFQNTGNDTAFNIFILDTLPVEFVDPLTFMPGATSHPCQVSLEGEGVVRWTFNDIELPDSTTDEAGSQGFVKFSIRQRDNNPIGTVIENSAAIYFDYNPAIITNTSFITVSDEQLMVSTFAEHQMLEISALPNPFSDLTTIKLGRSLTNGQAQMFDSSGRLLESRPINDDSIEISGNELAPGVYLVKILENNQPVGWTRLSVVKR